MIDLTTADESRRCAMSHAPGQIYRRKPAVFAGREGRLVKATAGLLLASCISHSVVAAPVVPAGLRPGEQYHLAFVTAGVIDAQSGDIDTYNAFVGNEASMSVLTGTSVGVAWVALASTDAIDAIDNAPVSGPIYLLDGTTKIADDSSDLWDGSIDQTFDLDQFLAPAAVRTWTGTGMNGIAFESEIVNGLGSTSVVWADTTVVDPGWINAGHGSFENTFEFPLYSISEPITVPPDLHGDATGDGIVGADDYTIWANNFGLSGATQSQGDFSINGTVEAGDYTIWANTFGNLYKSGPEPIPEPSAAALAVLALACMSAFALRRRRATSIFASRRLEPPRPPCVLPIAELC